VTYEEAQRRKAVAEMIIVECKAAEMQGVFGKA